MGTADPDFLRMAGCGQQKTASKTEEQNPGKTVGGQMAAEGSGCGPGGPGAGGGELRQGGESKPRGPRESGMWWEGVGAEGEGCLLHLCRNQCIQRAAGGAGSLMTV